MLTQYKRSKFIEKIITSPNGEQFRVVFLVAYSNGELKARPVSIKPLNAPTTKIVASQQQIYLPVDQIKTGPIAEQVSTYESILSPYTSLLFFTSQPTRAPSF